MRERAAVGMCADRTFAPSLVVELAERLEAEGADQLWVIEDCFHTAGVSLAAAAVARTRRLTVGLGILPAVARNPAVTAMEIATLCGLGPGRVLPGIGHGVQSWMAQMGARTPSPVTTLDEVISAVTALLAGEEVTMSGREVHLDRVRLDQPPAMPPPVLAGVRGPRSLALAGRRAGGVVLAEPAPAAYVRQARQLAGRPASNWHVAVFSPLCIEDDPRRAHRIMAPWLIGLMADPNPGLRSVDWFDELAERAAAGVEAVAALPRERWIELGPIGTLDDALTHLAGLDEAGVNSIGLFPSPDPVRAREQVAAVSALVSARAG